MYQAGIKKIILYENKEISFQFWNVYDDRAVTNIQTKGSQVLIENNQQPEYELNIKQFEGDMGFELQCSFLLQGLISDNINLQKNLSNSIYGWCALFEFYDNEKRFYNVPLIFNKSKIKPHKEMIFEVSLKTDTIFFETHLNFTANVAINQTFRCDSDLITLDSELISWDYEL